jgi:hypothetical protein
MGARGDKSRKTAEKVINRIFIEKSALQNK